VLRNRSQRTAATPIGAFLLLLGFLIGAVGAAAADFEVPRLQSAVTDQAGMLSSATRERLESALRRLEANGGTQLAILTVPNLAGLTIEQASIQVVDQWKLGTKAADRGVLLFVARDERRIRIEVGQGLEGQLTDAYSKRIIDEAITPLFREGDTDAGLTVGVYQIARITNPELDLRADLEGSLRNPRSHRQHRQRESTPLEIFFTIVLVLFVLSTRMGWLPFLFASGMGRRSYGGMGGGMGGFGGGGFSGGGGGFSGGGASGGW
jgi:uncharacterized protein